VVAGVLAGGVVAGRMVWADDARTLDDAIAQAKAVQIAEIGAADGNAARGVFARLTSTGHLCLSDAPLSAPLMGGGGCNPADDPLGGDVLSASLSYDGGPAIETVVDARLIGLVSTEIPSVRVLMSDGSSRAVRLKQAKVGSDEFQSFGYRFRKSDLRKGIGPVAIVAYDASGVEVGRQPTGIGG
jgi:hypothetical protein